MLRYCHLLHLPTICLIATVICFSDHQEVPLVWPSSDQSHHLPLIHFHNYKSLDSDQSRNADTTFARRLSTSMSITPDLLMRLDEKVEAAFDASQARSAPGEDREEFSTTLF